MCTPSRQSSFFQVRALQTLRTFNLDRHSLTKFCRDCITPLMAHSSAKVREAACVTVASILVPRPPPPPGGPAAAAAAVAGAYHPNRRIRAVDVSIVSDVLLQLLSAGIVDRKSSNRYAVVQALDGPLEPYLAKVEALRILFVFLYDDDPATRRLAVRRVGRLSDRNPAYVVQYSRSHTRSLLHLLLFSLFCCCVVVCLFILLYLDL